MEREVWASRRPRRPFSAEVAAVLLAVFIVMEATSLIGWNHTAASNISSPIGEAIRVATLVTSLLGIYGLVNINRTGIYLALLASVFETVLGATWLIEAFSKSQISTVSTVQAVVPAILGLSACTCIFEENPNRGPEAQTLDAVKTVESPPVSTSDYAVEAIDVTKNYLLGSVVVPAINGMSMRIKKGEFVAIMGPSGSGKSTLLNLIGALDRPSSGRILIGGVDISTLDDSGLARLRNEKIGFVFQAYNLIARSSVLMNMELPVLVKGYPKDERLKRVDGLLTIVGLNNKLSRKPKTLSGGEQQRVAIARALINDPGIVLADEPTGNLDSRAGKEIIEFLRKMNAERCTTVIVVTHNRGVAEMADRIIHLRDGKVTEEEVLRDLSI